MKQIVDKLNKIAKKIDANVDIPNTDLITDSLDAITTALGGTPNDSNLIVDKLEDIAGVAHGGGGGESTITRTYTLFPAGTYTARSNGDSYYIRYDTDYQAPVSVCTPAHYIDVTMNNNTSRFYPDYVGESSSSLIEYKREDGDNSYYFRHYGSSCTIDVPAAGDYVVDAVTETVTGKPVTVKPVDPNLNSFGISVGGVVGTMTVKYSINYVEGEVELPLDRLVAADLQIYD